MLLQTASNFRGGTVMATISSKVADLAGPGIGNYTELEKVLPNDYHSLLDRRQTQKAIHAVKTYIEEHLCQELNLIMTSVPLIVDVESGVNDYLDRDGSRTPSDSIFPTTMTSIPSMPRWCKRRPSGSGWP